MCSRGRCLQAALISICEIRVDAYRDPTSLMHLVQHRLQAAHAGLVAIVGDTRLDTWLQVFLVLHREALRPEAAQMCASLQGNWTAYEDQVEARVRAWKDRAMQKCAPHPRVHAAPAPCCSALHARGPPVPWLPAVSIASLFHRGVPRVMCCGPVSLLMCCCGVEAPYEIVMCASRMGYLKTVRGQTRSCTRSAVGDALEGASADRSVAVQVWPMRSSRCCPGYSSRRTQRAGRRSCCGPAARPPP